MAFTNFYLIAGGTGSADINAGSTIGAAVGGPTTGGSWTNATNTFVAASGTPFASASVGDYVSIYADGATVTTYVAQITTKVSSASVILSGTIKYGTAPTDGANNRSAVLGGSWNTEQVLAAGGLATTTVPQSTKINIKGNLTITANRTISIVGTTTAPLWFSGYNTNPGDLDNDVNNTLSKPIWTGNSTIALILSGNYQEWSNLSFSMNRNGIGVTNSGNPQYFTRCRFTNSNSGTSTNAATVNSTNQRYLFCYFQTPSTATVNGTVFGGNLQTFISCIFDTGGIAGLNATSATSTIIDCVFLNNVGAGVLFTSGGGIIRGCTFYGCTTDGIKYTGTPAQTSIVGCRFSGLNSSTATTNGINNASGTNTNNIIRSRNLYYNVTNTEVGMGDSPNFFNQTSANPIVNTATDMTPVSNTDLLNNAGIIFENESFYDYAYSGAVQPLAAGGSAVAIFGSE